MRILGRFSMIVAAAVLVLPATALAQTGAISGQVTDETGGVLPGVTITATSPAAISIRTTVTGGGGLYTLEALVAPGIYVVEYSLQGFSTVRREGVELSSGFTATFDTVLTVGSLEETVTVTGATPTVDLQNVHTQNVMNDERLNLLPQAGTIASFSALTLGVSTGGAGRHDVGGSAGQMGASSVHNNRRADMKMSMEGMNTNNTNGQGGGNNHAGQHFNMEGIEEVTMSHSGMSAETENAGLQVNFIPKDGGNQFSGSGRLTYTNEDFQSENLSTELTNRGVTTSSSVKKVYDYGASLGGPIKRDRVWFYSAHRWWGNQTNAPGSFFNKRQGEMGPFGIPAYAPDLSRPGYEDNTNQENSVRLTWQMSPLNKLSYFGNRVSNCICQLFVGAFFTPEATTDHMTPQNHLSQALFTRVHSNSILLEGGLTYLYNPFSYPHHEGVTGEHIPVFDLAAGRLHTASNGFFGAVPYNDIVGGLSPADQVNGRASVTYVTGSHNFKFGTSFSRGWFVRNGSNNNIPGSGVFDFFSFGDYPLLVNYYNHPINDRGDFLNMGFYAQDQWTMERLTLNLGVRFDYFDGWVKAQNTPATPYFGSIAFDKVSKVPDWSDISPRMGVAWDVRGNGKTAIKVTAGRYVASAGGGNPQANNPASTIDRSSTRAFYDINGDGRPQGDPANPLPNGELIGPTDSPTFGQPVRIQFSAPSVLTENRPFTWQYNVGIDQEIMDNVRVSVNYYRTAHFNQQVNHNENLNSSQYDPYCVTAPAGLSGVGGKQVCGFFDINSAGYTTAAHNVYKNDKAFGGDQTEVYNGVDFTVNAQFSNGAMIQGGYNLGRTVNDTCFVVNSPQDLYQCQVVTPIAGNQQIKFSGSLPLPYGLALSGVFQNIPGTAIQANTTFTNDQIAPSLGRNLSGCPAATGPCSGINVALPMLEPNGAFEKRLTQVDLRLLKNFNGDFGRLRVTFDLYNLFNANTVLARNNTFGLGGGVGWGQPTNILTGRLIKLGGQFSF
jgi:hypothetical protein